MLALRGSSLGFPGGGALGDRALPLGDSLAEVALGGKKVGDMVNLEGDVLGKYAARRAASGEGLTEAKLAAAGFI